MRAGAEGTLAPAATSTAGKRSRPRPFQLGASVMMRRKPDKDSKPVKVIICAYCGKTFPADEDGWLELIQHARGAHGRAIERERRLWAARNKNKIVCA
ncbi:MAG: hypothetical protein B7X04_01215 [Parcubacteria group bacterium 21-54-25]|nr:MAG: hypothetical protein B7X04_01215 [Parcubacteria group bacterium 21-54-25]